MSRIRILLATVLLGLLISGPITIPIIQGDCAVVNSGSCTG